MQTLIKPSAAIRQNYSEISNLCKTIGEPVFNQKGGGRPSCYGYNRLRSARKAIGTERKIN